MPEMDGIEFIKAARKLPETKFTPIIVLSGEADGRETRRGESRRRFRLADQAAQASPAACML